MTMFDERDKGFENKFAHDREVEFRIDARLHHLLGLWAAAKLGKTGADAEAYAIDLVQADVANADHVEKQLLKDFRQADIGITPKDIRQEMERLQPLATRHVMGEEA